MEPIAIILGETEIRWSSILIVLCVFAWFFYAYSVYVANGGKRLAMLLLGPLAVVFSYYSSRFIYWYCHIEQYSSFREATSLSAGGYAMLGIIPGIFLAAVLVRLVRLDKNLLALLDALMPATTMVIGLLYLIPLFDDSCRGKIIFSDPTYFRLPYSSAVLTAQGETEYRLATFFISFLVFMALAMMIRIFYFNHTKIYGATTAFFLLVFSASEFILDSTRYDAGYFQFNGFVSVLQIFAGVAILGLSIFFLVRSLKRNGFRWYHIPLFLLILSSMGGCGYLEYLIQRHGNWYVTCYSLMSLSCVLMVVFPYLMCLSGRKRETAAETQEEGAESAEDDAKPALQAGEDGAEKSEATNLTGEDGTEKSEAANLTGEDGTEKSEAAIQTEEVEEDGEKNQEDAEENAQSVDEITDKVEPGDITESDS